MAPEVMLSHPHGMRIDVYSVGLVMWEVTLPPHVRCVSRVSRVALCGSNAQMLRRVCLSVRFCPTTDSGRTRGVVVGAGAHGGDS
eukprot:1478330-Rhodomonas_salina.1